ncbi:MAG: hypothetical protein ACKO6N_26030 [Myxococcota bacterium]
MSGCSPCPPASRSLASRAHVYACAILLCLPLLCLLLVPVALAALLPGNFIIRKTTDAWKGTPSLVLERRIQGLDVNAEPGIERLTLQAGKVRRELHRQVQLYPPLLPAPGAVRVEPAATSNTEPPLPNLDTLEPPLLFDALVLQSGKQLVEWLRAQGIGIEQVTLVRQLTPDAPLPFRVLFRLGDDRPAGSWLDIEKERFLIRRLQLRQPDGSTWLAEYEGYGQSPELPEWLPQKIAFSRGGLLVETRTVIRRLSIPVDDALFGTLEPLVPLPPPPTLAQEASTEGSTEKSTQKSTEAGAASAMPNAAGSTLSPENTTSERKTPENRTADDKSTHDKKSDDIKSDDTAPASRRAEPSSASPSHPVP